MGGGAGGTSDSLRVAKGDGARVEAGPAEGPLESGPAGDDIAWDNHLRRVVAAEE